MINRKAVVTRHNVCHNTIDIENPLSVGNGNLCFTVDVTGTQSLKNLYTDIPLCTMASWGWHSTPFSSQKPWPSHSDLTPEFIDSSGRPVPYYTNPKDQEPIFNWLRENPHRFNLLTLAFVDRKNGRHLEAEELNDVHQTLDLWHAAISSRFTRNSKTVQVRTCCDPHEDKISLSVSGIHAAGLSLILHLPLPGSSRSGESEQNDGSIEASTMIDQLASGICVVTRRIDQVIYTILIRAAGLSVEQLPRGDLALIPQDSEVELTIHMLPSDVIPEALLKNVGPMGGILCNNERHWPAFWENSAAIDFSKSSDPRSIELERRIVLSRYLMAIQCSGLVPPQETGLTCNSWYGRFHLEMHYWHAVHFIQWNHFDLFHRSVRWYPAHLAAARQLATSQGYKGARWPKMSDPQGLDAPSSIGPLLIWQQPHPVIYAEILYKYADNPSEILKEWGPIVDESITFLNDYLQEKDDGYLHLGPGLIPAQESHDPAVTVDPTFELQYVDLALRIADRWHKRRNSGHSDFKRLRQQLAPLPTIQVQNEIVYAAHRYAQDTYAVHNKDHPSMLAALGWLDGTKVNKAVMQNTLRAVLKNWDFDTAWGWDFPIMAMTAARLGDRGLAFDCLMSDLPKNTYRKNGHNAQNGHPDLPLYLPGNGALLHGVASIMMLDADRSGTGRFSWEGWDVRYEDLLALPF